MRKAIFEETLKIVAEHNARDNETWQMGLNQFSDMLPHEISKYKGARIDDEHIENLIAPPKELEEPRIHYYPIDYRSWMNPVVSQGGDCGACWAFAATASIEGRYSIRYGYKQKLSEQQMIDCCSANLGCNGGSSDYALRCIMSAGGQMRESHYPYIGV
jgi:hypothetical protein